MRFPRAPERSPQFRPEWFIRPAKNNLFSRPVLVKTTISRENQKTVLLRQKSERGILHIPHSPHPPQPESIF
jgi:hypothetical protein